MSWVDERVRAVGKESISSAHDPVAIVQRNQPAFGRRLRTRKLTFIREECSQIHLLSFLRSPRVVSSAHRVSLPFPLTLGGILTKFARRESCARKKINTTRGFLSGGAQAMLEGLTSLPALGRVVQSEIRISEIWIKLKTAFPRLWSPRTSLSERAG